MKCNTDVGRVLWKCCSRLSVSFASLPINSTKAVAHSNNVHCIISTYAKCHAINLISNCFDAVALTATNNINRACGAVLLCVSACMCVCVYVSADTDFKEAQIKQGLSASDWLCGYRASLVISSWIKIATTTRKQDTRTTIHRSVARWLLLLLICCFCCLMLVPGVRVPISA